MLCTCCLTHDSVGLQQVGLGKPFKCFSEESTNFLRSAVQVSFAPSDITPMGPVEIPFPLHFRREI